MEIGDRPVALVLTRQVVPTIDRNRYASAEGLRRGGYILADSHGTPEVILIGTGSEVQLCLGAAERLVKEGLRARVVSLPCWQLFEAEGAEYREVVLPPAVRARVAVEAASTFGWSRYVGIEGTMVGIGQGDFGASAPIEALLKEFGFTVERIVEAARDQVRKHARSH
jgi:transketolase